MRGAWRDPLLGFVALVLVAALEQPVPHVLSVEREGVEHLVADLVGLGEFHVQLGADSGQEQVRALFDALEHEDAGLAVAHFVICERWVCCRKRRGLLGIK